MATVPVEITWVTGQIVTAAQLNANVRDAVNFLLSPPLCEVWQTVAQTMPNGGAVILMDSEFVDTDGMHSTSTNTSRITCVTAGRYLVWAATAWASNATGTRGGWYQINGSTVQGTETILPASNGNQTDGPIRTRSLWLNVGDSIEVWGWQSSGGGSLNTLAGTTSGSIFGVRYIGNA